MLTYSKFWFAYRYFDNTFQGPLIALPAITAAKIAENKTEYWSPYYVCYDSRVWAPLKINTKSLYIQEVYNIVR